MECWSCGAERGDAAFCGACGKIQPLPGRRSFFELFEMEPAMRADMAALDKAYRDRSRKVHPDRFSQSSAVERRLALEHTTLLNDAYRTLKDPQRRAEHLMKLRGVEIGAEDARTTSPGMLMEMMELGEEIAGAQGEAVLRGLKGRLEARKDDHMRRLERFFDEGEGTEADAARLLDELRYLKRLTEQIGARLG